MKLSQFYIISAISGVALILGLASLMLGQANLQIRERSEKNQAALQEGAQTQQFLNALIQDIAQAAVNDSTLEDFLRKNGISIRQDPGPGGTSAPAAPAPTNATP